MPSEPLDNGTREEVFSVLLDASGPQTPSTVAEKIDMDRELVSYHLGVLLDAGLIAREAGGRYYPQPVLTDPEFERQVEEAIQELFHEAQSKVFVNPDAEVSPEAAVSNAIRTKITLFLFSDEEESADGR